MRNAIARAEWRRSILQTIDNHGGNLNRTAKTLGITHSWLRKQLKVFKLEEDVEKIRAWWAIKFRLRD